MLSLVSGLHRPQQAPCQVWPKGREGAALVDNWHGQHVGKNSSFLTKCLRFDPNGCPARRFGDAAMSDVTTFTSGHFEPSWSPFFHQLFHQLAIIYHGYTDVPLLNEMVGWTNVLKQTWCLMLEPPWADGENPLSFPCRKVIVQHVPVQKVPVQKVLLPGWRKKYVHHRTMNQHEAM